MKHSRLTISTKLSHRRALKDISEALEQKISHAATSLHNGSPNVHATGLSNLNTSISQIHNYSLA